jgi:hypothetical protein
MRRFGSVVLGMLLVMAGAFLAVAGAVLLIVIGPDGTVSAPATRVVAPGAAVIVDPARFDAGLPRAASFSEATVSVTGLGGDEVFVGAGRASDVLGAISGTPYDVLVGADGRSGVVDQRTVDGSGQLSRPTAQSFWTTQSAGSGEQSITVPLGSAEQVILAANADGSAPVDLRWAVALRAPWAPPVAIAGLSAGLALLIIGGWCIGRGTRRTTSVSDGGPATTAAPDADGQHATNEWGTPIVSSDEHVPSPRTPDSHPSTVTPPVATPDEVDLRLIGAPAMVGASGPDAPPREPKR